MSNNLANGLYYRGTKIWLRFKGADGEWVSKSSGFSRGDEANAARLLEVIKGKIEAESDTCGRQTLQSVFHWWIERRRKRKIKTWKDDETRLRLHVMPRLGSLPIEAITPLDVENAFLALREEGKLAPKTVWNVYSSLRSLYRDAIVKLGVERSPCILTEEELGPMVDKDPEWREQAIYERHEAATLMFDPRLPSDRRMYYALEYLGGLRLGEASGLRVRHLELEKHPLASMLIARSYARDRTKTKTTKRMPIHPVLHTLLVDWIERGFPEMFGRQPQPDDFVVPRPPGSRSKFGPSRDKNFVRKKLLQDLEAVKLRHRRSHDLRRSFITHTQQDGGAPHVLIRLTHPSARKATAFAGYTEFQWTDYCQEVAKLQVEVPADFGIVALPMVVNGEVGGPRGVDDDDDPRPPPRSSAAHAEPPTIRVTAGPKRAPLKLATVFATENKKALENQGLSEWRRRESNPG